MADPFDTRSTAQRATLEGVQQNAEVAFDAGLRSHMLKVYNYMASGVFLTGIVAMMFAQTAFAQNMGGGMRMILMFSPLAFIMVISFGFNKMKTSTLHSLFWAFCVVMGLSMSQIFMIFSGSSIAQTFFATAAAFMGLSLFGYTTKRDLSGMGTFLIMGLVGLIVASIVNLFLGSEPLQWVISSLGVLIFAGLTAYDTQKIKSTYFQLAGTSMLGKAAIMGALNLYLDFVNMFQFLLSFLGSQD